MFKNKKQLQNELNQKAEKEMELQQLLKKEADQRRLKRANEVLLPLIGKECNSIYDAIITLQVFKQQIQNASAHKATQLKISEFKDEFKIDKTAEHSKRYEVLLEEFKDDKVEDVFDVLSKSIEKINSCLQKESQNKTLDNLLNDK